jgi:hypothetical protein
MLFRYDYLLTRVLNFMDETGLSMVETDGPYPGYPCSSQNHSHHRDLEDSIYWQLKLQSQFYRTLRKREVYINQPDDYFYQGGSKTGVPIHFPILLFSTCMFRWLVKVNSGHSYCVELFLNESITGEAELVYIILI